MVKDVGPDLQSLEVGAAYISASLVERFGLFFGCFVFRVGCVLGMFQDFYRFVQVLTVAANTRVREQQAGTHSWSGADVNILRTSH